MTKKKTRHFSERRSSELVSALTEEQQDALCQVYRFPALYPHQAAAAAVMAGGSDLLLLAGTSSGKTEAVLGSSILHPKRGMTVLIEPLKALQRDIQQRLERLELDAILLNSDLSDASYKAALVAIEDKQVQYVLTTPEQLEKNRVFKTLNSTGVAVVIVDEVHCLLDYGGDFRPAYNRIGSFIQHLDRRPVVAACTATLAPDSIEKVETSLEMKRPVLLRGPGDRPEIHQNIVEIGSELTCKQLDLVEKERFRRLKEALKDHIKRGDATIVYCNTVKQTKETARRLRKKGYDAAAFYADMTAKDKAKILDKFQSEKPPIVIATSAFGMGIDKPNVRLVVHMSMPLSIEDYWQKTGRAGRDGKKSHSYLFWYHGDYQTNRYIIGQNAKNLCKLNQLKEFLESSDCCVQTLRMYFGEDAGKKCGHCSRCR